MRIGVVSDTHGSVENAHLAVRMLESLEVDELLHCGDIGSPEVIEQFAAWPTHYVLGNCDYDPVALESAAGSQGQDFCGQFGDLELGGVRVALLHSHDQRRFDAAVRSGDYRLVCYGHTHIAKQEIVGGTLVLNPGALYRANPYSIAIVELPSAEATIIKL